MKTLDIRVAFSAVDRLTRPAENARRLMGQFGDSIQRTQGAIKNLERQARSFERARDAVSKADAGIVKARRQLNALNQLQRTGTVLSEKQQKLMQQLSTRLERLNESRTREIQKMRELGGELKRHGISLTGSDNTIQQAIRRTEQYNNQLERERQALARVTRARERYSRAQETAGKLKTGGALAIGAAAAGGYAAGRFLQPAIGFGKEMSRVQALTRIDQNSPQFKALREQALKLGSETQFTAGDAASGQAFLAMAGFTPQAIQAALPGVLSMATAGGMDLGETADIGSNILTQFGLSADQMDRVGDTLTAAFTRTNTDLRALGETMKYAGPVAALEQRRVLHCRITFSKTKNSKNRTVPISESLFEKIKKRGGKLVFPTLDYPLVRDVIKTVAPDVPDGQAVHALRHTFASHFMMNGGNILTLQKILGHAKIQTTMIYAHLAPDYLQDAVRFNPIAG